MMAQWLQHPLFTNMAGNTLLLRTFMLGLKETCENKTFSFIKESSLFFTCGNTHESLEMRILNAGA